MNRSQYDFSRRSSEIRRTPTERFPRQNGGM